MTPFGGVGNTLLEQSRVALPPLFPLIPPRDFFERKKKKRGEGGQPPNHITVNAGCRQTQ